MSEGEEEMKWMIASDIHGSAAYLEKLLEAYKQEKADRMLLLGDLLYHGPRNDLPEGYQPKRVIELLNGMKDDILCVRGNCEAEVDQMVLEFPVMAEYAILTAGTRMILQPMGMFSMRKICRRCIKVIFFCTVIPMCRSVWRMRTIFI